TRLTETLLQRQDECFADFAERNTLRSLGQGGFEAFDWFSQWLEAEAECLMMHRHDEARACVVCHFDRLLGRTMRPDPRVVSADGHDCEIDVSVLAQFRETVRDCSITGEDDPPPISLQQIAVVAAIVIMPLSCAPVFHRKGANIDLAGSSRESLRFAPIELGNVPEPRSSQQIARSTSADNTRVFIKTTERSQIEMVEVRVRKKDKIDLWQLMKLERGRGQSFW